MGADIPEAAQPAGATIPIGRGESGVASTTRHDDGSSWVAAVGASLTDNLADPRAFYETPTEEDTLQGVEPPRLSEAEVDELRFLFAEWSHFHQEGQLVLRPNRVWTGPGSFWRLPGEAKGLVDDLRESELVVFKGDLNYRKLVGDVSNPFRFAWTVYFCLYGWFH